MRQTVCNNCKPCKPMTRLRSLVLVLLLPLLCAWGGHGGTSARRDAETFILETLRKQEGDGWDRVGQYMIWNYDFDRARCLLTVERDADLGNLFQQRIPLATASAVGTQGSEIVFDCRDSAPCIEYNIRNRQQTDTQRVARTRLLVMDSQDLTPLMNAFAELHQLCRDPYGPARPR